VGREKSLHFLFAPFYGEAAILLALGFNQAVLHKDSMVFIDLTHTQLCEEERYMWKPMRRRKV